MDTTYDVAIVGGGSGGYVAAIRASQLGLSCVIIEQEKVGGVCLHRGCIPTKALLQSAFFLDMIEVASTFGIFTKEVVFDYAGAEKKRDEVVAQLFRGVEYLLKKNNVSVLHGHGILETAHTIRIQSNDDTTPKKVNAKSVIIATGSSAAVPGTVEIDGEHIITSDQALFLHHIPKSAIILGAGAVGVEFASMYRSFGVAVTIVEMAPQLVPLEDTAIGIELQKQFENRGITCLVNTTMDIESLNVQKDEAVVKLTTGDAVQEIRAEVLLIAVGRTPNVQGLGLEDVHIEVTRQGIVTNEINKTSVENVYAIGDVAGGYLLAHKAMHQGIIVAEAIAGKKTYPLLAKDVTRTTYCTPQIASVGLSEQEAKKEGFEVKVGTMPFRANGRALIWGEGSGFCKVVVDASTDTILGVHCIGHEVTELIYGPGLGMLVESTAFELGRAVAPHPTLSEVVGEAALASRGEAIHV